MRISTVFRNEVIRDQAKTDILQNIDG